jgi:hypothetical protein
LEKEARATILVRFLTPSVQFRTMPFAEYEIFATNIRILSQMKREISFGARVLTVDHLWFYRNSTSFHLRSSEPLEL